VQAVPVALQGTQGGLGVQTTVIDVHITHFVLATQYKCGAMPLSEMKVIKYRTDCVCLHEGRKGSEGMMPMAMLVGKGYICTCP